MINLSLMPTEWLLLLDFLMIAVISFVFYRSDNQAQTYEGKDVQIPAPRFSKHLIKLMFYGSFVILLGTLFLPSKMWMSLWSIPGMHILGVLIANLGIALFVLAKATLAESYSPCFNSFVPKNIVKTGVYRYFKHPIYIGNSLIFFGAALALGNPLIFTGLVALIVTYKNVAALEETSLKRHFDEYEQYASQNLNVVSMDIFKRKEKSQNASSTTDEEVPSIHS